MPATNANARSMLGFIALMSHVDVQEGDHDDQHHQCNPPAT